VATNSGIPWCMPWKNYRYPLTRLEPSVITRDTVTGQFATNALDIWIEDDYIHKSDNKSFRVIMTSGLPDECNTIYRPNYFVDGTTGLCDATAATGESSKPWFILHNNSVGAGLAGGDAGDNQFGLNVEDSDRATQSSVGNNQSLYMIAPGLYIGFIGTSRTAYSTNDEFAFTIKDNALDGIPKVIDNTYTTYCKMPKTAGDIIYTHNFPSIVNSKSLNFTFHLAPDYPKVQEATIANFNNAISCSLEGSIDGATDSWVEIKDLVSDWDWRNDGRHFNAVYELNALGEPMPYMRLKITHPDGSGSEAELQPHNWIKLAITPF
tara:strand:+ start:333 stop:1298 length:966 start_codon:yes stop_codon:yes gene_type:complete